jgi:hypothetical protein
MRRAMSMALAGWFAITMTLAQSCAAPAQSGAPYSKVGSNMSSLGASASPVSSPSEPAETSAASSTHLDTTGYTADQSSSEALSAYLKHRRLPLVGAQVLKSPAGERAVVLYGFVGSDFGKRDAVTKTRSYLADSEVPIENRIKVRPELLTAGASGGTSAGNSGGEAGSGSNGSSADESAASTPGDSQYPGVSSYEQQPSQAQQYAQQQNTGSAISAAVPLLMLGLMALSMTSGGSFAVGPGGPFGSSSFGSPGGSPFGAMPYNPYPGYSSPSPYGGAVTPYGGAGSPYTSFPPSTSPYYGP